MMKFVRSLFGWSESSGNRTVVGTNTDLDLKDVAYIKESNDRLTELSHLYNRYKGTPHEPKIKAVYDKTKNIHSYLVAKKKVHELALFHLQNTEHFITTFSVILDVHQKHFDNTFYASNRNFKTGNLPAKSKPIKNKQNQEAYSKIEMVKPIDTSGPFYNMEKSGPKVAQLAVPDVSIDTFANVVYFKEGSSDTLISQQIGYTSTELEKEGFLQYVSSCLGIRGISYVGNALVTITNNNGSHPTGLVPVIRWEGFLYALNLNDYRLFPVKINGKSR